MIEQWENLGAQGVPPVWPKARPGEVRPPKGDAAWLIRSPEATVPPWTIHAAHRPGIVHEDVSRGAGAWRVNVQVREARVEETQGSPEAWFASFDVIVESEAEAIGVVGWLLSEAAKGES